MRTLKALSPVLLVAALLAGCGGGGGAAKLGSGDVAVVGSDHITKAQFDNLMAEAKASYAEQGRSFPKQGTTEYESVKGQAISLLVQQAARETKAASMGVKVSDSEVQKRLDALKKQYFSGSDAKYKAQIKKQHVTDAQIRSDLRSQAISQALYDQVTKNVTVPQSEIDAYYKSHMTLYQQPATRDVRYILVGKSKATAESVYNQLKSGGDKAWCTLAKKYAKDASGQNCGKATFTKGQTVPVFDNAAFNTPTKTIHAPFYDPTQYKSWFVMEPLSAVKKATTTPEKQVAASIRQTLLAQDKNKAMNDFVVKTMKGFCSGKIKYAVGYSASPDPCAVTTTSNPTTTYSVSLADALVELQELTEQLRRECPWDREQTARTIVPHTVEEAYEVADAAFADDDAKLLDEVGDLLFQSYFLALLLQERGAGDLEQVARNLHAKLVSRHPHVFGDAEAATAGRVRERWEQLKRENEGREGIFHDVPEGLPALLYARKVQQRARSVGFEYPDLAGALADLQDELRELHDELPAEDPPGDVEPDRRVASELGDVLFAVVNVARRLNVDPELELRTAAKRFRGRVEAAEALAAGEGKDWSKLPLDEQDAYYDKAKEQTT